MKWLFLVSLVLLQGCAGPPKLSNYTLWENQHFYYEPGSTVKAVRWIRVSDEQLQRVCGASVGKIYANSVFLGCTGTTLGGTCIIHTSTDTTHQILGHELRHCFQGNFHP